MVDDIAKSVRLILQERITSPLSGAIIFSWFVWNWRLVYFLISPGENLAFEIRMKVIEANYLNLEHNLYYPLFSAVFLVGVYPFFTTVALWAWLWFKRWQNKIRQNIEKSQLVTVEQWASLRLDMQEQEKKFMQSLNSKDEQLAISGKEKEHLQETLDVANRELKAKEIENDSLKKSAVQPSEQSQKVFDHYEKISADLKAEIEKRDKALRNLNKEMKEMEEASHGEMAKLEEKQLREFLNRPEMKSFVPKVIEHVQKGKGFSPNNSYHRELELMRLSGYIDTIISPKGVSFVNFTEKGRELAKLSFAETLKSKEVVIAAGRET